MSWKHERARIGSLTRAIRNGERPADDPELEEAYRNFRAERLVDHVTKALAATPMLSRQQREHVASLLLAGDVA
jgi:hypothetical protein